MTHLLCSCSALFLHLLLPAAATLSFSVASVHDLGASSPGKGDEYKLYWETNMFLQNEELDSSWGLNEALSGYYDSTSPDGSGSWSSSLKNIVFERNRRKKLNERLFALRAIVPNINKPSTVEQAESIPNVITRVGVLEEKVSVLFKKPAQMPVDKEELLNAAVYHVDALEAELITVKKALHDSLMKQEELLAYIDAQQALKFRVVSTEARAMYNVGLAGLTFWSPNVNIFRDPRWGRGQETPGEDPLLSSKYASSYVKGLQQSKDGHPDKLKVASCCKHYTAYDLDNWKGVDRFHFNAIVSQQDLDDTFQPPFKSCVVDGNVASVMCSYNQVNGKPTCADPDLLTGIVRSKWKLNGYIVTDCDSIDVLFNSQHYTKTPEEAAADAILAGVDLNCGTFLAQHAEAAVKNGLLKESAVDTSISNNFATLMRLGFFDGSPKERLYDELGPTDVCSPAHQELALEAARQGLVLLKNGGDTLPFSTTTVKSLTVIGPNANVTKTMIGNYEGTPCKYTTPLQGLSSYTTTAYLPGCANVACGTAQVNDAAKLASTSDATILVMGIDQSVEAETRDRVDVLLPGQQQLLIDAVANASKGPVVLAIMSGGGFDIAFAKNNDKVGAILWVGYPGQAGGAAIADIIFGTYNPSGRLPMTWYPQTYVDKVPMTNMNMRPNSSTNYPGRTYRFYAGETVYSFGDGLSYSKFTHRLVKAPQNVSINLASDHPCRTSRCDSLSILENGVCQNYAFDVHTRVRNEGAMPGGHTVFLYYKPPRVHNAPRKHLVRFEKVNLGVGKESSVKFHVDGCRDLSLVDENGDKKIALGLHELHIGDLKHSFHVRI